MNLTETDFIKKLNYRDLIIFLVPLLIFSLYLFAYKPGILTAASYSQLHQIATGKFTNAYPLFHTFIETLCLRIRASPSSIGILQILVFCIIWTVICKYHRDDSSPSSDEFVLQFIVTLIICLIPINAVYSITLSSNILFSYAILFLCFLIKVMVDNDGQIDDKLALIIALTLACISGLNVFGVYISVVLLIIIIAYLFKKNNSQNTLIKLSVIAIACILLITSMNFIYHVDSDNGNFPMNDAFEDGVNLHDARSQFFSVSKEKPVKGYENVDSTNRGTGKFEMVDSYVNIFRENFILDGLFNNPILYMILSVILLGFIYFITQKSEMLLIIAPIIINMIAVFTTGITNLHSNILVFYLIVIILINLYFKLGLNPQSISSTTMPKIEKTDSPKPQQEQYIEPQGESLENDYSYAESEIDGLTLEDISEMLEETQVEETPQENKAEPQGDSDLIDEILKEIEMDKK